MKRLLILVCMITALGCSSTENIKIVSPSTPEKEAKEEIRKAPITRLETSSQPPAPHETTAGGDAAAEVHKPENIKIVSPSTPEKEAKEEIRKAPITRLGTSSQPPALHETTGPRNATESPGAAAAQTSIKSQHTLDALISLLEKKGVICREELLQEIKKLEMKGAE